MPRRYEFNGATPRVVLPACSHARSRRLVPLVSISTSGPPIPGRACRAHRLPGRPTLTSQGPRHVPQGSRHFAFESLESRELLAADVSLKGDVLSIRGTNRADLIDVQRVASGFDAGHGSGHRERRTEALQRQSTRSGCRSISQIVIRGRGGADQISIAENIHIPADITGNRGNDTILSGGGNDIILGGRGNDTILGSDGADSIDGGRGHDQIEAGGGADTCVGGTGNDTILGNEDDDFLDWRPRPMIRSKAARATTPAQAALGTTSSTAAAAKMN